MGSSSGLAKNQKPVATLREGHPSLALRSSSELFEDLAGSRSSALRAPWGARSEEPPGPQNPHHSNHHA